MKDKNIEMAEKIALQVKEKGGVCYYVGGFVRDRLLHKPGKDVDIEVHGISPEILLKILSGLGEVISMGASFGVYGLKHYDLDIALPRKENAIGMGHRDFEVFCDPDLGEEKAAVRRDFTVNAMMENVLSGEVLDFFHGKQDLEGHILRHVNPDTFAEDALRVLRCAQFAARFEYRVAPETLKLCGEMDLSYLARERVAEELKKALLKADKPSVFFEVLRQTNQLEVWFPELSELTQIQQNPKYHPEGNVWNHTMLTLNAAAHLREQANEPYYFMMSALCHDLGKITATRFTEKGIRSIGHEKDGIILAETFLSRFTSETGLYKYVKNMIALHMRPNMAYAQNNNQKVLNRIFDESLCPKDLLLLCEADFLGQQNSTAEYEPCRTYLTNGLCEFERLMALPYVRGADLQNAGLKPGKGYAKALEFAHTLRLSGVPKEVALQQVLRQIQ